MIDRRNLIKYSLIADGSKTPLSYIDTASKLAHLDLLPREYDLETSNYKTIGPFARSILLTINPEMNTFSGECPLQKKLGRSDKQMITLVAGMDEYVETAANGFSEIKALTFLNRDEAHQIRNADDKIW